MSKVSVSRWKCDKCSADGGEVDDDGTIPYRWASIGIMLGCPQLQSEQRPRTVHFCDACTQALLFESLAGPDEKVSDNVCRLRAIFKRAPVMSDLELHAQKFLGNR